MREINVLTDPLNNAKVRREQLGIKILIQKDKEVSSLRIKAKLEYFESKVSLK